MGTQQAIWDELTADSDPAAAGTAWAELQSFYGEAIRSYHNGSHLNELLDWADRLHAHLDNPAQVHWAILYHDVIYVPGNADNEERSAELAEQRMRELGVEREEIEGVCAWIRATKSHGLKPPHNTSDGCLFLDMDLAVLGSSAERYERYADQIRTEFKRFPDQLYKPGRCQVLKHFLDRKRIYSSDQMHELMESAARFNLAAELTRLQSEE